LFLIPLTITHSVYNSCLQDEPNTAFRPVLQRSIQGASGALSVPAGPSFLSHPLRPTSLQEARQSDIPRKRNSDVLTELSDSDSDAPRPKKPRLDPQQKHPLLAVNPNLPPYTTTQQTTVVPNPPVMVAPAASPGSVIHSPHQCADLPASGSRQSINERSRRTCSSCSYSVPTSPSLEHWTRYR
jgi:hypothetical protein